MELVVHLETGVQPVEYSRITCICQVLGIKMTVLPYCYHAEYNSERENNQLGFGGTPYTRRNGQGIFGVYIHLSVVGAVGDSSLHCAIIKKMTKKNYGWRLVD